MLKILYLVGKTRHTIAQVKRTIHDILTDCLEPTLADIIDWIEKYVPARTHQLRDSLLERLNDSHIARDRFLKVVLGSDLEYAKYVNDFNTSQVRHSGEIGYAYYYGFHGKMTLDDPTAIGNFWGLLQMHAKDRLRHHLRIQIFERVSAGERRPYTSKMKVT